MMKKLLFKMTFTAFILCLPTGKGIAVPCSLNSTQNDCVAKGCTWHPATNVAHCHTDVMGVSANRKRDICIGYNKEDCLKGKDCVWGPVQEAYCYEN